MAVPDPAVTSAVGPVAGTVAAVAVSDNAAKTSYRAAKNNENSEPPSRAKARQGANLEIIENIRPTKRQKI